MGNIKGFVYAYRLGGEWELADDMIFNTLKAAKEQYGHNFQHIERPRATYQIISIEVTGYKVEDIHAKN